MALTLVLVALTAAGLASSRSRPAGPQPHALLHRTWKSMSLGELEKAQARALAHYRYVSRFYLRWRKGHLVKARALEASVPPLPLCAATGIREPSNYCWYASAARWTAQELAQTKARALARALAWPAHHALWMCIHGDPAYRHAPGGEGAWDDADSGHNGHFGGLQMHPGWGYGTSYYANEDSQLVQEQAADRGYRASGYSRAWLNGQWGQTIGPCWRYAN